MADDEAVADGRVGHNIVAWRNYIYEIGGCTSQNATSGACNTALSTSNTAPSTRTVISLPSPSRSPSGTSPCSGASPYNCDLPSGSGNGLLFTVAAIINGYLYVAGGCTTAACTTTSKKTAYAAVGSTGELTAPANCVADGNSLTGAWCIDSAHTINPGNQGPAIPAWLPAARRCSGIPSISSVA